MGVYNITRTTSAGSPRRTSEGSRCCARVKHPQIFVYFLFQRSADGIDMG
jgi:hypothetical protein